MGIKNATAWVTFNLVVIFFMGCEDDHLWKDFHLRS